MSQAVAALVLALGLLAPGHMPGVVREPTRLTVPVALMDSSLLEKLRPRRGASRDRTLAGKARRAARRAARA